MEGAMAKREIVQTFEAVFENDEDGGFHVYVPALKGCHSWGATRAEAREHIKEAIELWLESAKELGIPIPDRETVEVATE
jgi:predicted RNase H-like HicB family nuclease